MMTNSKNENFREIIGNYFFFSCLKADGRYQELVSVLPKRKRNKSDGKYIWDYRQTSD